MTCDGGSNVYDRPKMRYKICWWVCYIFLRDFSKNIPGGSVSTLTHCTRRKAKCLVHRYLRSDRGINISCSQLVTLVDFDKKRGESRIVSPPNVGFCVHSPCSACRPENVMFNTRIRSYSDRWSKRYISLSTNVLAIPLLNCQLYEEDQTQLNTCLIEEHPGSYCWPVAR